MKNSANVISQITSFSEQISKMSNYIQQNKKDFVTKRSLYRMVSKRKALLAYLSKKDVVSYNKIVKTI
jgi:small subunit ribosomal protein S15